MAGLAALRLGGEPECHSQRCSNRDPPEKIVAFSRGGVTRLPCRTGQPMMSGRYLNREGGQI